LPVAHNLQAVLYEIPCFFAHVDNFILPHYRDKILHPGIFVNIIFNCFQPFTEELLNNVKDKVPPVITITSPASGSYYQANVLVSGTVVDYADDDVPGRVVSLSYEVLSTQIKDDASFDSSGNFSFYFNTTGLSGSLTFELTAMDWNGNISKEQCMLSDGGSDIPSFEVVPESNSFLFRWDEIPDVDKYYIRVTPEGGIQLDPVPVSSVPAA